MDKQDRLWSNILHFKCSALPMNSCCELTVPLVLASLLLLRLGVGGPDGLGEPLEVRKELFRIPGRVFLELGDDGVH